MMHFSAVAAIAVPLLLCGVSAVQLEEGACSSSQEGLSNCQAAPAPASDDDVSLMQIALSASKRGRQALETDSVPDSLANKGVGSGSQCSSLANKGAYFTVSVGIGTPRQDFDLVADTGSDALIVPDCKCVKAKFCEALDNCFATENSTSFGLDIKAVDAPNASKTDKKAVAIMGAKMNYGSGQIQVLVASEKVKLANIETKMHNGVFLMEDRRSLQVHGKFEGILGLGLPHKHPLSKQGVSIPAFLQASAVPRYSLCFNEMPHPGALRTHLDALPNPMTNIGTVHWGLDLQGFSVGGAKEKAVFCDPNDMDKNQKTACGAIPDSGTTLMMGPPEHILKLYATLCDQWSRCAKAYKKSKTASAPASEKDNGKGLQEIENQIAKAFKKPAGLDAEDNGEVPLSSPHAMLVPAVPHKSKPKPARSNATEVVAAKAKAFHNLLSSCEDWMTKEHGVKEIPSIFLHLAGKEGKPQAVELSSWSFIVETTQDVYKVVTAKVFGSIPIQAAIPTGKKKKVCTASFGPQVYKTKDNGPVWILGAPLFYATTVGYGLGQKPEDSQMSFMDGPCAHCSEKSSLISTHTATGANAARTQPRHLAGPIREPGIDMSGPF